MKEAGLVDHEFSAKALFEDELLVVAGLHPAPDTYDGPLDRFSRLRIMRNRAVVRKFIPKDVPAIPTSSGSRPVLLDDLPADLVPPTETPSSSRFLRPALPDDLPADVTPLAGASSSTWPRTSPSPVSQVNPSPFPQGTPIIEVGTSEENTTSQTPSDLPPISPLPPPVEALSSSLKRPLLTPRLDPRASSFNMRQATHHSDVETLSRRLMQSLGSFILAQASTNQYRDDGTHSQEREARLVDELEALRVQLVEKDKQITVLTSENEVVRASTVQAYTQGREEVASSAVAALKNSHEYAVELSRHGSSFYIDGFATVWSNLRI
ncbi:hypothetical protein Salat_2530600 [Sesamum alatum]|uniref:Uncharacterized protein n=1 Tax=Sesamum alatum TaxID=300844 RepID=A0AAE2CCH4_9LAMI|nr:hypothetical protein Salat_2530600 [Sesamum alatum]